jgi:hypothetical protein
MNTYVKILLIILISILLLSGCKEDTPTDPPEQTYPDYYPTGIGSTYKYAVTEKDSMGNLVQEGTRNILFSGTALYNGINYTTQDDSLDFGSQSSVSTYLVRKSDTGVFYAMDTSQIALLIPDSLKQYVTLRTEMQLLFYPLTTGSAWSLYRITAEVQPGIEVKILDIIASFEGIEQLAVNLSSGTIVVNARKVKYTIQIFTEIGGIPETYTAFMWYYENIGLVKFEGNQFIIDAGGGGISFEPTSDILSQELTEYNIN